MKRRRVVAADPATRTEPGAQSCTSLAADLFAQQCGCKRKQVLREFVLHLFRLQATYDVLQHPHQPDAPLAAHGGGGAWAVQELGLVGCEFVAVVHAGGRAALWGQHTGRWLGWLNTAPEERVQSVWARGDGGGEEEAGTGPAGDGPGEEAGGGAAGLVVVTSEQGALHARAISLRDLRRHAARPDGERRWGPCGRSCFTGPQGLLHPGFLEFDSSSGTALVMDAVTHTYRVYDLTSGTLQYTLAAAGVRDAQVSQQYLLLVGEAAAAAGGRGRLPLRVLAAASGLEVAQADLDLEHGPRLAILQLCNHHLLLQQPPPASGEPAGGRRAPAGMQPGLLIYDALTMQLLAEVASPLLLPDTFLCPLDHLRLFLAFHHHTIATFDFTGRQVAVCESAPFHTHDNGNAVGLSDQQPLLVVFCQPHPGDGAAGGGGPPEEGDQLPGSIRVINVLTGQPVVCLAAGPLRGRAGDAALRAALTDVTMVQFSEDDGAVWSGTFAGGVHRWSCS